VTQVIERIILELENVLINTIAEIGRGGASRGKRRVKVGRVAVKIRRRKKALQSQLHLVLEREMNPHQSDILARNTGVLN
tara:strand:- start:997 stop:1236 length:240 start_codon:yes stop_codon:yes gene_type:complete